MASGHLVLYPSAARLLLESHRTRRAVRDPLELRSVRELEVLIRTVKGFTATELGARLRSSPKTVATCRQRAMEKLDLHHPSELVRFARERGLLSPTPT